MTISAEVAFRAGYETALALSQQHVQTTLQLLEARTAGVVVIDTAGRAELARLVLNHHAAFLAAMRDNAESESECFHILTRGGT